MRGSVRNFASFDRREVDCLRARALADRTSLSASCGKNFEGGSLARQGLRWKIPVIDSGSLFVVVKVNPSLWCRVGMEGEGANPEKEVLLRGFLQRIACDFPR